MFNKATFLLFITLNLFFITSYTPLQANDALWIKGFERFNNSDFNCSLPWTTADFEVSDEVINFNSPSIDISCTIEVCVSITLSGVGSMEDADYVNVYYSTDGHSLIPISENVNAFSEKTVEVCDIIGSTLSIEIEAATSHNSETYFITDLIVFEDTNVDCSLGPPCDDNDPCTIGETYDMNCDCGGGIFNDQDNNGICDAEDNCLVSLFESQNLQIDQSNSVQQMIETNGVVTAGSDITYTAQDYVLMTPEFNVEIGAMFHAFIAICNSFVEQDCSVLNSAFSISHTNPGCTNDDGTVSVIFDAHSSQTEISLSLDGGNTFPVTLSDESGSYTFTGLSNAEYEVAAQYGDDCFFNVGTLVMVQDCGDIPLSPGGTSWMDSYEANGLCWCTTNFDHDLDTKTVTINGAPFSVVDICDELEMHPLFRDRESGDKIYNDVQCGNGPLNDSSDEPLCPGRVDIGVGGCLETGSHWDMSWLAERDRFQVNNLQTSGSSK